MKLDIILVDLAVVTLVVVPYILFIIINWHDSLRLKNKFIQETSNHLGKAIIITSWNQIMTGLDKTLQKLVLVQKCKEGFRVEIVDLKIIRSCKITTQYTTVKSGEMSSNTPNRIDIEFTGISGEKSYLNLFDHNITYRQDFELEHAKELYLSIKSCLNFKPVFNSAA